MLDQLLELEATGILLSHLLTRVSRSKLFLGRYGRYRQETVAALPAINFYQANFDVIASHIACTMVFDGTKLTKLVIADSDLNWWRIRETKWIGSRWLRSEYDQ